MTAQGNRANYGVDAPGVMLGLMGAGAGGVALGALAIWLGPHWAITLIGAVVAAGAVVPLVLGLAMGAYALLGKGRTRVWLLSHHNWRGDERVLDVGAGRGFLSVGVAHRLTRGRVTAIDIWRAGDLSGNGADALRDNARIEGVSDRIEVITADARAMDFPDESFDVVVSLLCLHNIEPEADRMAALREIVRVLKPGGRALIGDYTATPSYARAFRDAGLVVRGPINGMAVAYSLMSLVVAEKPPLGPKPSPV